MDCWTTTARFKERPRSRDICFERRYGVSIGDADDGLSCQVDYGVDLILAQHSLEHGLIANVTANDLYFFYQATTNQFRLRYPISYETDNIRAALRKVMHERPTDQSSGASHQSRPINPEAVHSQTFHGGCPWAQ